jgi:hypothetical protein
LAAEFSHDLRDAVPIATSALLPSAVLVAALLGWLDADLLWAVAIGVTLIRLSMLGPVSAWIAREPVSLFPLVGGVFLALSIAAIAVVKALLTH